MTKTIVITIITLAVFASIGYFIAGQLKVDGNFGLIANDAGSADGALSEPGAVIKSGAAPEAIAEISKYQYTETYLQPDYNFSFKYPKDFMVSQMPDGSGGEVVLVQNILKNIGIQILITENDEPDSDITEAVINESITDLKISEPQEVLIGLNRKGLAFKSDNSAFGGASREVWFIYGGNIYQISTYAEFDGFLQGLFGTWEFE